MKKSPEQESWEAYVSDKRFWVTCVICGFEGHGGLGYWAWHADEDVTPVCTGKCFRAYFERKLALRALAEAGYDDASAR